MASESLDGLVLGRALTMLRVSRGLSQRQLADLVRTSAGVICRYENGRSMPSYIAVHRVLRAMGCSFRALESAQQLARDGTGYEAKIGAGATSHGHLTRLAEMVGKATARWFLVEILSQGSGDSPMPPAPRGTQT
jgi:transcriptional regulator with XRE-family HTH domain